MKLSFLPEDVFAAVRNLNVNRLTEIRLRRGQPVLVEYGGKYSYLNVAGVSANRSGAIVCGDVSPVLNRAMAGCVYSYSEQLRQGFITVDGGVRIGVAGEYVADGGEVKTIARATSLNIRIPHCVCGCSQSVFDLLFKGGICSVLLFSRPGFGKTTMLRDLTQNISRVYRANVLVLDTRNEISGAGESYDLGETVDYVRSCEKLPSLKSAIRAMRPDVIVTDELYGENDIAAVKFARACGIAFIASSHVCDEEYLVSLPFDYYVKLNGIGAVPEIYDKDFNAVCDSGAHDACGKAAFVGKEETGGGVCRTV